MTGLMTLEAYERLLRITRIGNRAVRKAQEENKKKGIPNVYARNGKPYYEMPDGIITTISPFTQDEKTSGERNYQKS